MLWSEAEARKKRHIIRAKKKAWDEFASQLNHPKDQNFIWAFAKKMLAKGQISWVETASFRMPSGQIALSLMNKSGAPLESFDLSWQLLQSQNLNLEMEIDEVTETNTAHPLNCDKSLQNWTPLSIVVKVLQLAWI